jgi:hypothetical protein
LRSVLDELDEGNDAADDAKDLGKYGQYRSFRTMIGLFPPVIEISDQNCADDDRGGSSDSAGAPYEADDYPDQKAGPEANYVAVGHAAIPPMRPVCCHPLPNFEVQPR